MSPCKGLKIHYFQMRSKFCNSLQEDIVGNIINDWILIILSFNVASQLKNSQINQTNLGTTHFSEIFFLESSINNTIAGLKTF